MNRIVHVLIIALIFVSTTFSCKRVLHKTYTNFTPYEVTGNSPQTDKEIEAFIQPYKTDLDKVMNTVIGECMQDMPKRRPESLLGNWMADAIHKHSEKVLGKEIAFAVQNYGGIRIPMLSKGPITRGKIFELMPFDNTIAVLNLNAAQVEEFVQHMVLSDGWPVSHSINATYAAGNLNVKIRGEDLKEGEQYLVAVPDYIANGGSDCSFFIDREKQKIDALIRDVLIDYVIDVHNVDAKIEGRFSIKK